MKSISFESLKGLKRRSGGLNSSEVEGQRALFGTNDIVEVAGNLWLELLFDTIKDPMIWFLIGIGTIFFFTGELSDSITLCSPAAFVYGCLSSLANSGFNSEFERTAEFGHKSPS